MSALSRAKYLQDILPEVNIAMATSANSIDRFSETPTWIAELETTDQWREF